VSLLVQAGAEVRVAMTPEATRFVSPLTFEALSGQPVASDLFGTPTSPSRDGGEVHIALSDWAEALLVMPATANFIAKLAHGLADEVVSTTVLATTAPLVLAPAMHNRMWEQPATMENVEALRRRGVVLAGPVEGHLASGDIGMGRLADQDEILRALRDALPGERDMADLHVVVTSGGTREPLDPVRYIGNRSSGMMGHSIAAAAEARGARVTLVTASAMTVPASSGWTQPTWRRPPGGPSIRRISTSSACMRSAHPMSSMPVRSSTTWPRPSVPPAGSPRNTTWSHSVANPEYSMPRSYWSEKKYGIRS